MARLVNEIDNVVEADVFLRYVEEELSGKYGLPVDVAVDKVLCSVADKLGSVLPEPPFPEWLILENGGE